MDENCLGCLFSVEDETLLMIDDLLSKYRHGFNKRVKCNHENSPYYNETVSENVSCRLYINSKEYFKMKDRKEHIDKLKDNIKKGL